MQKVERIKCKQSLDLFILYSHDFERYEQIFLKDRDYTIQFQSVINHLIRYSNNLNKNPIKILKK